MALIGLKYPIAAPIAKYEFGKFPEVEKGTAFVVGKMISADKELKFADNPLYADDEVAERDNTLEEGSLKICVDHMTLEAQAKMFGHTYTKAGEEDGSPEKIIRGGGDIPPYHVFGYYKTYQKNGKKIYETTLIYKAKFLPPKESAKTKEKSISWGTYESEGKFECLSGLPGEPYEETAQFKTEDEARKYLEDYFKLLEEE